MTTRWTYRLTDDHAETVTARRYDGRSVPDLTAPEDATNVSGVLPQDMSVTDGSDGGVTATVHTVTPTPSGPLFAAMALRPGDWLIRTADGSVFVTSDDRFRGRYEPVPDGRPD